MDEIDTPEKAELRRAAKLLGGQAALASALGFRQRAGVQPWFTTSRRVPAEYCPEIERLTRRLAAEKGNPDMVVTCEQLRPDVSWGVLREQAIPLDANEAKAA